MRPLEFQNMPNFHGQEKRIENVLCCRISGYTCKASLNAFTYKVRNEKCTLLLP